MGSSRSAAESFHPDYRDNGRFFVYYSAPLRDGAPEGWDHTGVISEFAVSAADPDRADTASERVILRVDQSYANHNGGHIGFGPDGSLFIPLGDGGNGGDIDREGDDFRPAAGNGQTITTMLGSILRIDVDGVEPYAVPEDNPFIGQEGVDEIYAYGFRNPYGSSFDLETGDMYVADAGQGLYEEVSRVEKGGNYGWNVKEGTHCFNSDNFDEPLPNCPDIGPQGTELVDPLIEYKRGPETGSVIVAGVMYRGDKVEALSGRLVLADYARDRFEPDGVVYAAIPGDDGELWDIERVVVSNPLSGQDDGDLHRWVLAVSQDMDGELYVLTTKEGGPSGNTGEVFLLDSADAAADTASWVWWVGALSVGAAILALVALALGVQRRRLAKRATT